MAGVRLQGAKDRVSAQIRILKVNPMPKAMVATEAINNDGPATRRPHSRSILGIAVRVRTVLI